MSHLPRNLLVFHQRFSTIDSWMTGLGTWRLGGEAREVRVIAANASDQERQAPNSTNDANASFMQHSASGARLGVKSLANSVG